MHSTSTAIILAAYRGFSLGIWALIAFVVLSLVVVKLPSLNLSFAGYQSYVVVSSSMEPTIWVGDIIFVKPSDQYTVEDIITFSPDGDRNRITHRIIASDSPAGPFETQGDNNQSPDPDLVALETIVGKYHFHIPMIGVLTTYGATPIGIVVLILVPMIMLGLDFLIPKPVYRLAFQKEQ
jgi:signal peptidase I